MKLVYGSFKKVVPDSLLLLTQNRTSKRIKKKKI